MNKQKLHDGMFGAAVGVLAGGIVGLIFGGCYEELDQQRRAVVDIREDIKESTERALEIESSNLDIQKYGKICLSLVGHYAYGGNLDGTEVDTPEKLASAVLTVDGQPCGKNMVEALSITQDIVRVQDAFNYFQQHETNNVNNYQQELRESISLAEQDEKYNWVLLGALGSSILFGSMFGIGIYRENASSSEMISGGDSHT